MQPIQEVVEDFVQRDLVDKPPVSRAQIGQDMCLELLFSYTGRDSAHGVSPLLGSFSHDALSSFDCKSLNQFVDKRVSCGKLARVFVRWKEKSGAVLNAHL